MGRDVRVAVVGCALVLPAACALESAEIVSNGEVVEALAIGVTAHSQTGLAPNPVLIRAVDAWGIGVGPGEASVGIEGSTQTVTVDPFGYAVLTLEAGVGLVDGDAVVTLDSASAWPDLPELQAPRPAAAEVATGRRGVLVSSGSEVWWTGPGLPDHPVADLGAPVKGIRSAQMDDDGVPDAVVWGGERVVLLRGRSEGGAGFGVAIEAPGWEARAAAVGDLDDDGDNDLAIAWDTGTGTVLQAWAGQGPWALAPVDESALVGEPSDMAIARDLSDGKAVITLLVPGAEWQRYRLTAEVLAATGNRLDVNAVEGSRLLSPGDITGDGIDELVVVDPRREGSERRVDVWNLGVDRATVLPLTVPGGWVATGDADLDGVIDLWLLAEDGALRTLSIEEGRFTTRDAGFLDQAGPIGLSAIDGDPTADLVVAAGDGWHRYTGVRQGEEDVRWLPERATLQLRDEGIADGLVAAINPDSERGIAAVVAESDPGPALLQRFVVSGVTPTALAPISLAPATGSPVDLAACEDQVWVLFDDEVLLVDTAAGVVVGRDPVDSGVAVACAPAGSAVRGAVVTGSAVRTYASGLSGLEEQSGGGVDVAIVDGVASACASACASWPWPDGMDALVTVTAEGLTVQIGADTSVLPGSGDLLVQDSNGDGEFELWARDVDGRITVLRASAAGPVSEGWRGSPARLSGPAVIAGSVEGPTAWFASDGALTWLR